MKYIVLCLFLASLCSIGMVAVAEKLSDQTTRTYGDTMSQLILNQQSMVSGFVFQSKRGVEITTNRGTFLLKGTADESLVGKTIRVKGVIRGDSIFALKVVGLFGLIVLSRAIFSPLKTLSRALLRISTDKKHQPVTLKGGEEFFELAQAFNDMSLQLYEEETIRNEFIATLSHEIRTPLSSIRESVNMIVEEVFGPINDKQRKFLKIASVEIQRINKLLNHLLNVSVLESDVRKKSSTEITAGEIVRSSSELFSSQAEKKKVTIKIKGPTKARSLYGVREELQQVFVNIIGNAIKFSPESSLISITWQESPNNSFIIFAVSDTGPGIAQDELSLIFTKYYRTKKVRGHLDGVGLGLAISKKIVNSYGGKITVVNNETQGCTFCFSLPTM